MKTVALGKVAKIDRTVANDDECLSLPYVGLEHVEKERGHFADGFVPTPLNMLATNFRFTPKHVLYGKLRPYLNKVVLPNFDGVCTTEILPILPNEEKLDRTFLWAILLSPTFVNWATSQISGANLPRLDPKLLVEYEIPLPSLTEQKRIASLLARADRLRQLRRTAHDLGDALLQSVFLEMFGDPFRNEKGWERIEIAELIRSGDTINYGVVQPGDDFPNGTPVIRVGDLDNLDKDITSLKLIDPKIEASYKRSRIVGDEILIACVGSIGKIALATEKMKGFNIVRAVARVPADYSLVNRLFLAAYLSMPIIQDFFQRETRTVAQPTLNITQIEETPILMPPLSLQEEFAGVVARVESLRGRMGESTRQVEGLFESLLAESFGR
ncbi:MAG: restriction endonuclease subunit S [Chloroflexi bacterium]|nr:restriction endonuclease subunit S [Chloroflexota bacterium]